MKNVRLFLFLYFGLFLSSWAADTDLESLLMNQESEPALMNQAAQEYQKVLKNKNMGPGDHADAPTQEMDAEQEEAEADTQEQSQKQAPEEKRSFWSRFFENFVLVKYAKKIPGDAQVMAGNLARLRNGKKIFNSDADRVLVPSISAEFSGEDIQFSIIDADSLTPEQRLSWITVYNNMGVIYPVKFLKKSFMPFLKEIITWLKRLQFFLPTTRIYVDVTIIDQIIKTVSDNVLVEINKTSLENIRLALEELEKPSESVSFYDEQDLSKEEALGSQENEKLVQELKAEVPAKKGFWKWLSEFFKIVVIAKKIPNEAKKMKANIEKIKQGKKTITPAAYTIMIPSSGLGFSGDTVRLKRSKEVDGYTKKQWVIIYNNMTVAYANKFLHKVVMPLCKKIVLWFQGFQDLWPQSRSYLDLKLIEQILETVSEKALADISKTSLDNMRFALENIELEQEPAPKLKRGNDDQGADQA